MTLQIYADARPVTVIETDHEGPRVAYEEARRHDADRFPISLNMPLGTSRHGPELAVPWLMDLLPEGEPLRAMTYALGVGRDDILGLIAEPGRDLAGALTIGAVRPTTRPDYRTIDSARDLERIIAELPNKPFLVGDDGVSMSLEACGLSKPGVIRRLDGLIARLLAELPAAVEEVGAMPPKGKDMAAMFAASIGERARLVQTHAREKGDEFEPDTPEPDGARLGEVSASIS